MKTEHIELNPLVPGQPLHLIKHTFGQSTGGRSAYLHAGLHADEHPGILVLHHVSELLHTCEQQGKLKGEIVVVPFANPVGLLQNVLGCWTGRFNLADGENFNRQFPDLNPLLEAQSFAADVSPAERIKAALDSRSPVETTSQMKQALMTEALKHDLVLDLHCDSDAMLHLYTNQIHTERATRLANALGAGVVFVEEFAGGQPFDESIFRTWKWFADKGMMAAEDIPFSVTVELRGQSDVNDELARQDALGIIAFLAEEGLIELDEAVTTVTEASTVYPLEGSSYLRSPATGILSWYKKPGDRVSRGECIAEIVHPDRLPGEPRTMVTSDVDGVLVAKPLMKMIRAGQRVALLAGSEKLANRQAGSLLSSF